MSNPLDGIRSSPPKEEPNRLFGHSFEIKKFREGDRIAVGGVSVFSPDPNITVGGDFERFEGLFKKTHEMAERYDIQKLKEWLGSQRIDINEKLFARLFAFTKEIEQQYPENPERSKRRQSLYRQKRGALKLSDIFKANAAECAEVAALAQAFLQGEGISSSYFSGDVLWDRNQEFSEEHSFVVIHEGEKTYIFDPANPTNTNSGKFPSIYTTGMNFEEEMSKKQKKFVTATNLLSKKQSFYGTNDGSNVLPERDIV